MGNNYVQWQKYIYCMFESSVWDWNHCFKKKNTIGPLGRLTTTDNDINNNIITNLQASNKWCHVLIWKNVMF